VRDNLRSGGKFGYRDATVATEFNLKVAGPSGRACFQGYDIQRKSISRKKTPFSQ
jgi:hypothetical protein